SRQGEACAREGPHHVLRTWRRWPRMHWVVGRDLLSSPPPSDAAPCRFASRTLAAELAVEDSPLNVGNLRHFSHVAARVGAQEADVEAREAAVAATLDHDSDRLVKC